MLTIEDSIEINNKYILKIPEFTDFYKIKNILSDSLAAFLGLGENIDNGKLQKITSGVRKRCQELISWEGFIYEQETGNLIGKCGIVSYHKTEGIVEVGYWIGEDYRNKGVMSKALSSLIEYIFKNTIYKHILIRCNSNNLASQKLAIRMGFQLKDESNNILYFYLKHENERS